MDDKWDLSTRDGRRRAALEAGRVWVGAASDENVNKPLEKDSEGEDEDHLPSGCYTWSLP